MEKYAGSFHQPKKGSAGHPGGSEKGQHVEAFALMSWRAGGKYFHNDAGESASGFWKIYVESGGNFSKMWRRTLSKKE